MPTVRVSGVPAWVDALQLLGQGAFAVDPDGVWVAQLGRAEAADLAARLRGLGMGGHPLVVDVRPSLKRSLVRAARTTDARRRRDTSPGFAHRGARLDDEGRRSLTPERLALELGQRAKSQGIERVIDAFAGAGGNAIGFARAGCSVLACELDEGRVRDARHNANLYDVADGVEVRHGDVRQLLPALSGDLLFLDPPWEGYDHVRVGMDDVPLLADTLAHEARFSQVWLKLPPSFDVAELPGFEPEAVFGHADGDARRVKFLLLRRRRLEP